MSNTDNNSPTPMENTMSNEAKCPFSGVTKNPAVNGGAQINAHWWPHRLRLNVLHQHSEKSDPMGEDFNYAAEF